MRIKDILLHLKKFPKKKQKLLEALGVASPTKQEPITAEPTSDEVVES